LRFYETPAELTATNGGEFYLTLAVVEL